MNGFLDSLLQSTGSISNFLWGLPMIVLLFGTGLLLTFMTGFVQIRNFGKAARFILGRDKSQKKDGGEEGDISPFQALMTALAATVKEPSADEILPHPLDRTVAPEIARAVRA